MNLAEKLIAHIGQHDVARTDGLAKVFKLPEPTVDALLRYSVQNGTLVACEVKRPGTHDVKEYRVSVSGGGAGRRTSEYAPGQRGRPRKDGSPAQPRTPKRDPHELRVSDLPGIAPAAPADEVTVELGSTREPCAAELSMALPREPGIQATDLMEGRVGAVETGIPVPRRLNGGAVRIALAELQPGQSRLLSYPKQSIRYAASIIGMKVALRADKDGAYRVWRLE